MARLLIAGYGFLGQSIKSLFTVSGWSVETLTRSGEDGAISCDISLSKSVDLLQGEYDLIIHCAASGGGGESGYRQVYLEGCRNLIKRFPKTPFIFTSSTSVYDQKDHSEVTEDSMASPTTATGQVLREAEDLVLGSGGTVARLSGLYGPGRCHVLKNLLNGTAHIDGQGERVMNFIHRDDVARALLLFSEKREFTAGEIYNVTATPVSQYSCYAALAKHFDKPIPPSRDAKIPRKRGNSSKAVMNTKLRNLGWSPEYDKFLSIAKSQ